jgi:phage tail sheath gpL-like
MIPFKQIPDSARVPLFYAELDPANANSAPRAQRTLLIGQVRGTGNLTLNVPSRARAGVDLVSDTGQASILAAMVAAYRGVDPDGELWVLPVRDDPDAVAASGTVTFTGTTTAIGTLRLYIAGQLISVVIAAGQTAAMVALTVTTAINAASRVPVVASAAGAVVTLFARNKGECGNDIDVRVNYLDRAGGETLPDGLTVAIVAMSGGALNPSLTAALTNLQDEPFDVIVCSLTDVTSMAAVEALLDDTGGRWSWSRQIYGHCVIARRGTAGTLAAYATALNSQHVSCVGYMDSPSPPWMWAAAFAGAAARSLRADPGLPVQSLAVPGVMAPPIGSRFGFSIRNATLLYGGVTTWTVDATGTVAIENMITTYVTDAQGTADNSYLEIETLFLLMFVLRRLRDVVTTKYGRVKLATDGVRLLPGSNVVTPSVIRADLIAAYRELEAEGMVQNSAAFAAGLIVEKNGQNPNRVDVQWPGTLINQLRIFALLAAFRLN